MIDNPDYKPDPTLYSYSNFGYIGLDLWQVKAGSIFSNFVVSDSFDDAKDYIEIANKAREVEKKAKEAQDEIDRKKREEEEKAKKPEEDAHAGHDHGQDHDHKEDL